MNNTLVKQNAGLKHSSAMFGNKIMVYVVNVDVNVIMQVHQCKSSKSLHCIQKLNGNVFITEEHF